MDLAAAAPLVENYLAHAVHQWEGLGSASDVAARPTIASAQGVWLHTEDDRKLMDLNSQAMCVNLGHNTIPGMAEAVQRQLAAVPLLDCR